MPRLRRSRAIATIIGGVLLAIALLAMLALYFYLNTQQKELLNTVSQAAQEKISTQLLASSLQSYYTYDYLTGTLTITITSNAPRAVTITSIDILWDNQTTLAIDRYTELGTTITATITSASGATYTVTSFPVTMAPGDTLEVTINQATQPITISATLSASPAVAVITIKNKQLYTSTSSTTAPAASLLALMDIAPSDWTQTWKGIVNGTILTNNYGNVASYNVLEGELVSGNAVSLNISDGNTMNIDTQQAITFQGINITNNLVYATDFESGDPFTSGTWGTIGGTWSWNSNIGYNGTAGIQQTSTRTTGGIGGEYIAYPTSISAPSRPYYVMSQIYTGSGYNDIVLFNSTASMLYEFSIDVENSSIDIWIYNPNNLFGWELLNSAPATVNTNIWYTSLVYYNPSSGYMRLDVYDANGLVGSVSAVDTTFTPTELGVGTYRSSASFDNFIVSYANPRFVNFTVTLNGNPVSGWTVELYSGSLLVASNTTNTDGIAVLDVTWHPIVRDARIVVYDSQGDLVLNDTLSGLTGGKYSVVYGGNAYSLSFVKEYVADLVAYATIPDTNPYSLGAKTVFLSNISTGSYTLWLYNWSSGAWLLLASGSYSGGTLSANKTIENYDGLVNTANDTVKVRLIYRAPGPASISIDMLNALYQEASRSVFNALLVAPGGLDFIEVYQLPSLTKLYDIPANTVFNGTAAITYSAARNLLVLVNATGIYTAPLSPSGNWTLLTTSCRALQQGVDAEAINTSTDAYLVVLTGGNQYCVVSLNTGALVANGTLPGDLVVGPPYSYPASAHTSDFLHAYFIAYNKSSGQPVIIEAAATSTGVNIEVLGLAPGSHPVGMAYTGNNLWVLLERGGLYQIDLGTGETIPYIVTLPFLPWGPGDRLEAYNTTSLLFIRADGTREIWLINITR